MQLVSNWRRALEMRSVQIMLLTAVLNTAGSVWSVFIHAVPLWLWGLVNVALMLAGGYARLVLQPALHEDQPRQRWCRDAGKARPAAVAVAAILALATPLAMQWEGKRNTTYLDIGGVPTACYGQTGSKVRLGATYPDSTCDAWLQRELGDRYQQLAQCIPVEMAPHQAAALTVFAYNVGIAGACNSAAARYARAGDWPRACRAIQLNDRGQPAWSYVGGRFVQGLANRRAAERALCEGRAPR
ncbi:lysozyme [Chitiniphilus eburneus]|uniref:lysozyme n=1 Tax=Chitiniphilus eburneus TaxID=2571148 RepID=UPI0035CFD68A